MSPVLSRHRLYEAKKKLGILGSQPNGRRKPAIWHFEGQDISTVQTLNVETAATVAGKHGTVPSGPGEVILSAANVQPAGMSVDDPGHPVRITNPVLRVSLHPDQSIPPKQSRDSYHNADFTMVHWYGTEYHFALAVQSPAVRVLWEEWERTKLGLHQQTIRDAIDPERDGFRMDHAFRGHPAFGTMIQQCGDGKYKLAPPPIRKKRDSSNGAKITSKSP